MVPGPPATPPKRVKTVLPKKPPLSTETSSASDREERRPQAAMTAPETPAIIWGKRRKDIRGLKKRKERNSSSPVRR